jgi:hypothetical protein
VRPAAASVRRPAEKRAERADPAARIEPPLPGEQMILMHGKEQKLVVFRGGNAQ